MIGLGAPPAPSASRLGGPPLPLVRLAHRTQAMGGRLEVHVAARAVDAAAAEREIQRTAARVRAWATLLTRHDPSSQLMRLNGDARPSVAVGPSLGAALAWAREAGSLTDGVVDASLLDARLRAQEASAPASALPEAPGGTARVGAAASGVAAVAVASVAAPGGDHRWELVPGGRHRSAVVARAPGVRLDLDGVAKGWLADRALALLRWPGALVDADGDIAIRCAPGDAWEIGIGDPRDDDALLAILRLPGGLPGEGRYGVATSGTSVHRWGDASDARHHLIDPATGVSARSDVVQATVIARTAREAEAYAKLIVIRGAAAGLGFVEHADALGAVALLDSGRTVALPRTSRFLA